MPEAFVRATASLLFGTILLVPGQRGGWLQPLSRQCVKCGLGLQSNFCYSGKVRIEGKVFNTVLFKDLNKEERTVEQDPWSGILACQGDFGQNPQQFQLPFHGKDTVLASFMVHSQIH